MKKLLIITAVALSFACSQKQTRPADTAPQYYTHTISSQGETLASIAKWYTGSANNWQAIQSYNPGLDVRRMRIGTQIQIPNNMLIRTSAMPRNKAATTATAKQKEEELLAPAQESLANSQAEVAAEQAAAEAASQAAETAANIESYGSETDTTAADTTTQSADEIQQGYNPESETSVTQLTAEEIAAMDAQYGQNTEAEVPQKKSFLSKFQEAAMKAQEKSIGGSGTPQAVEPKLEITEQDKVNAAMKTNQEAMDQAKAAQDAANAQVKAAQEQASKAVNQAQKDVDAANQNSNKTREDLIKELTQDY